MIELLHGDCMDYMAGIGDNAFELAIVDPPYGINADGGVGGGSKRAEAKKFKKGWDSSAPDKKYFKELKRVSKNQIIWGANHFIENCAQNSSGWIVWDKREGLPTRTFSDAELALSTFKRPLRIFRFQWDGMIQQDMKNKEHRIHPTQKPVKLYQWLLANYAKEGDRILDTHLGSGSSAIAAHYGGFDFVGIELDENYYNESKKRFYLETAQVDLFGGS